MNTRKTPSVTLPLPANWSWQDYYSSKGHPNMTREFMDTPIELDCSDILPLDCETTMECSVDEMLVRSRLGHEVDALLRDLQWDPTDEKTWKKLARLTDDMF